MTHTISQLLERTLTHWIGAVHRHAWLVILGILVITAPLVLFVANNLRVNVDSAAMMDPDLPFRKSLSELEQEFPMLADNLLIVVDAEIPELALEAASALTRRMEAEPELFKGIFAPAVDPFFERHGLLYLSVEELEAATGRMVDAEPLLAELARDPSLRGLSGVLEESIERAMEEGTVPAGLVEFVEAVQAPIDNTLVEGRVVPLSWQRLFSEGDDGPVPFGSERIVLVVEPQVDFERFRPARAALERVHDIAEALERDQGGRVRIRVTGSVALNSEEMTTAYATIYEAGGLSLVIVGLVLALGLRSAGLVLATLITLMVGLIWTAAFAVAAVEALNLMSVAFAVLFIGLGVDFAIHVSLRFREELGRGVRTDAALASMAGPLGRSLVLCAITTALAFFALLPTAYSGLAQLGMISGIGVLVALVASLTVLPALLSLLPVAGGSRSATADLHLLHRRRSAGWILAAAAVVAGAAVWPAREAHFEVDRMKLRDTSTPAARAFSDLLTEPERSPYTLQLLVNAGGPVDELKSRLERHAEVDSVVSLKSFVPEDQMPKLGLIEDAEFLLLPVFGPAAPEPLPDDEGRLEALGELSRQGLQPLLSSDTPELVALKSAAEPLAAALESLREQAAFDPEALARVEEAVVGLLPQTLARLEQSLQAAPVTLDELPPALRERYLSADGTARLEIRPAMDLSDEGELRAFVDAVQEEAPAVTGGPVIMVESASTVTASILQATLYASVLVVGILALAYRRLTDVVLSLIPIVFALLLTVAGSVLLDLPFNFANVIVLPLAIGIGVDSAIHMVMRARELHGDSRLLQTSTPRAVLLSALTTAGSFGTLAFSAHRGISSMGALLVLSLVCLLIGIRVVLPALMAFLPPEPATVLRDRERSARTVR